MKSTFRSILLVLGFSVLSAIGAERPDAAAALESRGAKVMPKQGAPEVVVFPKRAKAEDLALLADLPSVTMITAQHYTGDAASLEVLHQLPKLGVLNLWDSHEVRDLSVLNGLPVKRLLIGGAMGLGKTGEEYEAIFQLKNLPNLEALLFAHRPHVPTDRHVAHVVETFPNLDTLRLDFGGRKIMQVTRAGVAKLGELKRLKALTVEGAPLPEGMFEELATFEGLERLELKLGGITEPAERAVVDRQIEVLQAKRPRLKIIID